MEPQSPLTVLGFDELEDALGPLLSYTGPEVDGSRQVVSVPYELQKVSHTHHAIMDYMIANPTKKMSEIAAAFHYTPAWLSTLVHSDVFQRELSKRRAAWQNVHDARLSGRILKVAELALDRMVDALEPGEGEQPVSASTANEIGKTALSALGFIGQKKDSGAQVAVVNNIQISADDLRMAQAIMQRPV